jgi:hypothetical protein
LDSSGFFADLLGKKGRRKENQITQERSKGLGQKRNENNGKILYYGLMWFSSSDRVCLRRWLGSKSAETAWGSKAKWRERPPLAAALQIKPRANAPLAAAQHTQQTAPVLQPVAFSPPPPPSAPRCCPHLRQPALAMSKKKGLSVDEKKVRLLDYMQEHKEVYTLKELESSASKAKGIGTDAQERQRLPSSRSPRMAGAKWKKRRRRKSTRHARQAKEPTSIAKQKHGARKSLLASSAAAARWSDLFPL